MINSKRILKDFKSESKDFEFIEKEHSFVLAGKLKFSQIRKYKDEYKKCPLRRMPAASNFVGFYKKCQKTIKSAFYDSDEYYCYLCGMPNALELDHFHPQKKVPQYAISRLNLTYICGSCNKHKSDLLPISELFLKHPYLDPLFNKYEALWDVSLLNIMTADDGEISFHISVHPRSDLRESIQAEVIYALVYLNIAKRVQLSISKKLYFITKRLKRNFNVDITSNLFKSYIKTYRDDNFIIQSIAYSLLGKNVLKEIKKIKNRV